MGKKTEEVRYFLGDARLGSEVSKVAEHLGPLLVEIAGADVCEAVGRDTLAAGDQKQLGVHLQSRDPKTHLNPGFLQDIRHADVVLFVKTSIQFNDRHDLFAVVCCVDQGVDDARIVRNAVEVDVNGFDRRVNRRLAHQIHDMPKIVVGIIQQNVLAQHLLDQAALAFQKGMLDAFSALENGVFASEVWKTDEVLAVVVTAAGNEVVGSAQLEFLFDHFQHGFRHRPVMNHTHEISLFAGGNACGHLVHQRGGQVIVHVDFRVTRHLDGVCHYFHRSEQAEHAAEFIPNDIVDERDVVPIPCRGQNDKPR